ncbi:MAG: hypothetical protein ACYCS1_04375 [Gammaproteobacteria bacterium]
MVNVTPATAPSFPITYTWDGQVYNLASVQGFGCVDTVYSTTYNGSSYNNYVVLPANQALVIVDAYEAQFAVPNLACNSLITQADLLNGTSTSSSMTFGPFAFDTPWDIIVSLVEIAVIVVVAVFLLRLLVDAIEDVAKMFGGRR